MILLKSNHEHVKQPQIKQPSPPKEQIKIVQVKPDKIMQKKQKKIIKKQVYSFLDPLIPENQNIKRLMPQSVFQAISETRRQLQVSVYSSFVENKKDYIEKLFKLDGKSQKALNINRQIKDISQSVLINICDDIMDDEYQVKTANQMRLDSLQPKGYSSQVIRITQEMLKRKITGLKVDLEIDNDNNFDTLDFNNPKLYAKNNVRTRLAHNFVKQMQKQKQQLQKNKEKRQIKKLERERRKQQELFLIELRNKQQKHEMLQKRFQKKRIQKELEKVQSRLKKRQYKDFIQDQVGNKPLYQKKQEQFFRNFILAQNKRKMNILSHIKYQHQPIPLQQIRQHEQQYLAIKQDFEFERNAGRMIQQKRRKKIPRYFKNSYHLSIQKEFSTQSKDPLSLRLQNYHKRSSYSTQIKHKFVPKVNVQKRNQFKSKIQQEKERQKKRRKFSEVDRSRIDGKNNLRKLHEHIQALRQKGKIQKSETLDVCTPRTTKPLYRDYMKEINSQKKIRNSIDLGSIKYPQHATMQVRNKERVALRKEKYLQNGKNLDTIAILEGKKQLEEDFLQSARAKMAIINRMQGKKQQNFQQKEKEENSLQQQKAETIYNKFQGRKHLEEDFIQSEKAKNGNNQ